MLRVPIITSAALLALAAAGAQAQQTPAARAQGPGGENPRIHEIVRAVQPARIESDVRTLAGFGTRHTLSDTTSPTRGIGAARRWIFDEFQRISRECGGCLEVSYVSEVIPGNPQSRIPVDTRVVNVVAIQRGQTDPGRYVLIQGHYDSRVTDVMNATADAPGANDDASGTSAAIEAARVLSKHRFDATHRLRGAGGRGAGAERRADLRRATRRPTAGASRAC